MKKQTNPTTKAHLIRGAFYLLLLLAVCVIPFGFGQWQASAPSLKENPTIICGAPVTGTRVRICQAQRFAWLASTSR